MRDWNGGDHLPIKFPDDRIASRMCQHGPADVFFLRYRDDLITAQNVTVHIGSTALALEAGADRRSINRVQVTSENGARCAVTAKVFVLAGGGIENAQLLLLSEPTKPGEPGNLYDNVGRYLTDHPEFRMGSIRVADPDVIDRLSLYDLRWDGPFMVSSFLTIQEEVKRSQDLLNMSVALVAQSKGFGTRAHYSMATMRSMLRQRRIWEAAGCIPSILNSPRGAIVGLLRSFGPKYQENNGGWSQRRARDEGFDTIELWAASEQTPSRENRISLSTERDRLGRTRPKLEWSWAESDRENVSKSIGLIIPELERVGLGRYMQWAELLGPRCPRFLGLHHPMGTTRMHRKPEFGVVDEDCLVHGLHNLYIAGSSVFPTGHGYANPTLTILALTQRLADRIRTVHLSNLDGRNSRLQRSPWSTVCSMPGAVRSAYAWRCPTPSSRCRSEFDARSRLRIGQLLLRRLCAKLDQAGDADVNGNVTGVFNFVPLDCPYGDIVKMVQGPDGALYYVDIGFSDQNIPPSTFGVSKIRRISFVNSDLPPVVSASAIRRKARPRSPSISRARAHPIPKANH